MKLIIGLGNPGKKYEDTRHNVGFMALEYIQQEYGFPKFTEEGKLHAELSGSRVNDELVILAKPTTFMNLSGDAVSAIKKYYKLENEDILVIYDDIDIPLGTSRYRETGSGGTHNGMKHIVKLLGEDVPRFRIGIKPEHPVEDLSGFVLGKMSKSEQELIKKAIEEDLADFL